VANNRIKLFALLFGFLLNIIPVENLFSQQSDKLSDFDAIYSKGMDGLNSDKNIARKCLDELEIFQPQVTPVQKAKANFLRLKLIYSDSDQIIALEKRMFAAPDTLPFPEANIYSARKYLEKSMPDKAVPMLMDALDSLTDGSDKAIFCKINLCEAYREKQEYAKGIDMLGEILNRKIHISDENRAFAYNRTAAIYNEWENPKVSYRDSVIKYSELCITLSEKINSKSNLGFSRNELSFQCITKKQYHKALDLSKQAVKNFREAGMIFSAMNALINQSSIYIGLKDYELAQNAAVDAANLCSIEENRNLFMRLYLKFGEINYLTGNYKDAYDFLSFSRLLQLDFFRDRISIQINEQSARYDLLVKEQRIGEEKQKNEFHQKQVVFLFVTLIVLCIAFIASFFYFRIKRKEFIKQKLIEAVVETESSERKRIARDLHDGLGPVLSAINHYFQAYIDADTTDKESIQNKMQQVISGAIDEVSRISHNISPYVLENHGLNTALKNFIAPLINSGKINIEFTSDFFERFEPNRELTIYRCITELLNNTMKHADASRITIDIRSREKVLYIFYADNGKGFDLKMGKTEGMGLYNIKNRIETFGGKLSIDSSLKKGIKVKFEIPL